MLDVSYNAGQQRNSNALQQRTATVPTERPDRQFDRPHEPRAPTTKQLGQGIQLPCTWYI